MTSVPPFVLVSPLPILIVRGIFRNALLSLALLIVVISRSPCVLHVGSHVPVAYRLGILRNQNGKGASINISNENNSDSRREVGRGARSLKTREGKRPSTSRVASKAKAKRRHLRAQPYKEELEGLPTEAGLVLASRTEQL